MNQVGLIVGIYTIAVIVATVIILFKKNKK